MISFALGEVYFRITYPETTRLYPIIESFVYLGKNLSDEDVKNTCYFQFASDYGRFGSALDGIERPVVCVADDTARDMLDIDGLIPELKNAGVRRASSTSRSASESTENDSVP